jgi:hypothetical protein
MHSSAHANVLLRIHSLHCLGIFIHLVENYEQKGYIRNMPLQMAFQNIQVFSLGCISLFFFGVTLLFRIIALL